MDNANVAMRRLILETIRDAVPAPVDVERLQRVLAISGYRLESKALLVELAQLESLGYLANLKHASDPVYKGVTGAAVAQLDMSGKLDPALWGDLAL